GIIARFQHREAFTLRLHEPVIAVGIKNDITVFPINGSRIGLCPGRWTKSGKRSRRREGSFCGNCAPNLRLLTSAATLAIALGLCRPAAQKAWNSSLKLLSRSRMIDRAFLTLLLCSGMCGCSTSPPTSKVRLNEIQVIGSHNSYH